MPSLLSHLGAVERKQLLEDLNYMNLGELRGFCKAHGVPYAIYFETPDGQRKRSKDTDRKSVVLERVVAYLKTGEVPPPTCFVASVVKSEPPPAKLRPQDRLYYGWYDKKNPAMIKVLRQLTGGAFRNGAVARILAREFWTKGVAPTFTEYAAAWERAEAEGLGIARGDHPEAAWLTDRARGDTKDWKAKRVRRAKRALNVLNKIPKRQ